MLCFNMISKFEKPVIVGKAGKPRFFKGIGISKRNGVVLDDKGKIEWLLAFDLRIGRQNRKVVSFVDNPASHFNNVLNNMKFCFHQTKLQFVKP